MVISYRATPTGTQGIANTPISVPKQSGTQVGDWIFIYVVTDASPPTGASCPGFGVSSVPSNGASGDGALLYRLADGTEGSTFTVTLTSTGNPAYVITTIADASGTLDPTAIATPTSLSPQTTSVPVDGITLANANDWVLWFAGANPLSTDVTIAPPSGFTNDYSGSSTEVVCCVAHATSFGTGATGVQTGTLSGIGWSSGVMVGLKPGVLTVNTTSLPNAIENGSYSVTLTATGGSGAGYTWSVSTGSLPGWISLNTSTGVISGTAPGTTGSTSFTVEVIDSASNTATQPLTLTVAAPSSASPLLMASLP